ncbi:MAG TPA: hypothetical protein VKU87_12690 [Thermomicrobiaceae bacterium]|nr:hypothetical protein [Thermomicrobiaceae bacterium]
MRAPTRQELADYAEQFASQIAEQTGEELNFGPSSLATLDAVIGKWLDLASVYAGQSGQEDAGLAVFTAPMAAYLGEIFVRNLHGVWETNPPPDVPIGTHIVLAGKLRVNVFKKARDVLAGLERPTLSPYYSTIANLVRDSHLDVPGPGEDDSETAIPGGAKGHTV